jgi:hypothetical protein
MSNSFSLSALAVFVVFQSVGLSHLVQADHDETAEPPLGVKLVVDGQTFDAQIGRAAEVSIRGEKVQVIVTQSDERELKLQHLHFRYPSYFKYEVSVRNDTEGPVRWDLEGADVDVTVFRVPSKMLRHQQSNILFGEWITEAFETRTVTGDAGVLELGQMKIRGTKYTVPLSMGSIATELMFDAFEVPGSFDKFRYFLVLVDWDGENPEEELLVRNLLRKSFKVGKQIAKNTSRKTSHSRSVGHRF